MTKARLDHWIARLLLVTPQSAADPATSNRAENAFQISILYSAVRCTIQYIVLPFILPLVGLATEVATQISLLISVLAILAIVTTLRHFWRINYARKWQYLGVAVFALMLLSVFIYLDVQAFS